MHAKHHAESTVLQHNTTTQISYTVYIPLGAFTSGKNIKMYSVSGNWKNFSN